MGDYRIEWTSSNRKSTKWEGVRPVWGGYDEMWGQELTLIKYITNQRVGI